MLLHSLLGRDIICEGNSGMGKTFASIVTILNNLVDDGTIQHLFLISTRTIAWTIRSQIELFGKYVSDLRALVLVSGVPINVSKEQLKARSPNVVVGDAL